MPGEQIDVLDAKNIRVGTNDSTTAVANSAVKITNRGTGDAALAFEIGNGTTLASIGLDNSNSDNFSIQIGSALSTNGLVMDSNNNVCLGGNPASNARLTITPLSGDGNIRMTNTTCSETPTSAGILLVSAGALVYIGSSGTTTVVASA